MFKIFLKHYLRRGKLFKRLLSEFEKTEKFSNEELRQNQNDKLKIMIQSAYNNVPYYRNMFKMNTLTPENIQCVEDLEKLPILEKETVRSHFNEFKNKNHFGFSFKGTTSGTTGTPAVFLRNLYSINLENAALWRQYRWAGKEFDSRRITLRGEMISPLTQNHPPFWKYDPWTHELKMSSYHLTDENMKYYLDEIVKFKPYDLYAYPSIAYLIANYCSRFNIKIHIPCVFTSSEMLLDFQKQEINKAFNCKIYDWYGSAERVSAICHCEMQTYHEISDYSITEYLPLKNGKHEIIGTTLYNELMPLIRYRTGDIVDISETKTCSCGRSFRVIKSICGRNNDYILLKHGKKVRIHGLIFKGLFFVKEALIIQHSLDEIEVKAVFSPGNVDKQKDILTKKIREFIGDENIEIRIDSVKKVERNDGEKFQLVKSLVQVD